MTLSQILLIVRSRWVSALVVFALVVGAIVGLSLALPRQYTATASVVLDVKSPDPIAGVVLPGMVASGYMATQVDVVQSERVMRRAIESLQLDKDPLRRAQWQEATDGQGDFEAWMAEEVQKKMSARPGKDSNVILVSYTARDPKAASAMANAVVKAYIDTTVELRTEPARQYNVAFEESTRNLRAALESAQSKLSAFQQREGILVNDERLDVENERLSQLSTQVTELQAVANESAGRQSQAGARGSNMSEALSNQTISLLATDLARQQAKLNELESRYGDQHPQIVEMRANVKELRSRLEAERGRITSSLTVNNTVNQSRLQSVRNDLATQRAKVLRLKGLRDESAVLLRDVENAQREYDAAFAKRSQSTLESQTTQTNVSILKTATPPAFASSPRMSLNLAVALLLGAGLALATAIFRERLDWRLRSDTDVIELLKQPLLGVLPDRPTTYLPSSRRRSMQAVANRVLGRQPLLGR